LRRRPSPGADGFRFTGRPGVAHSRHIFPLPSRVTAAHLERQLIEAQLETLQRQLQPHFLFNTLHAISTLVGRNVDMLMPSPCRDEHGTDLSRHLATGRAKIAVDCPPAGGTTVVIELPVGSGEPSE
jgi:hypothetical protein